MKSMSNCNGFNVFYTIVKKMKHLYDATDDDPTPLQIKTTMCLTRLYKQSIDSKRNYFIRTLYGFVLPMALHRKIFVHKTKK